MRTCRSQRRCYERDACRRRCSLVVEVGVRDLKLVLHILSVCQAFAHRLMSTHLVTVSKKLRGDRILVPLRDLVIIVRLKRSPR